MELQAIKVFQEIEEGDIEFLSDLEKAADRFEWIPDDRLTKISDLPEQDIEYRLSRLNKFNLVTGGMAKYEGYRILPAGYDTLALWNLAQRDILEAFGRALGIGKEADIYDAITPTDERVAVKFNRLGLSFKSLKETRSYSPKHGWIDASKDAARREFQALKKLHPKVEVPEPIAYDRHVLVTSLIEGEELSEVADIDLPEPVLDEILRNVKEAYKTEIIHGDLSEHNILTKPNGEVLIIDWPQWKPADHSEAEELLRRDVKNILKYFRRKFQIDRDLEEVLEEIKENSD
ncbi:hypothetical protein AKJ53_00220 [candidate division MSBL1 archaeon SCGC-AAA382F02]|uniref:non-specific serine/threonine protein kinase n=1 Tax=candidate division MSBL1 archaeon SCGC-AAA382F02 TaxID=1698282 RepID=A0A133VJ40_9EURY|nr:hypothetical protein AKJ53_00220 [candidate division MSBL1 archaeon SCGC-AAA382F02]